MPGISKNAWIGNVSTKFRNLLNYNLDKLLVLVQLAFSDDFCALAPDLGAVGAPNLTGIILTCSDNQFVK